MLDGVSWTTATVFLAELTLRIGLAVRIIMRRETPGVTFAWLNLILLVPLVGAAIYLLIGESRLGRLRARQERLSQNAWADWLVDLRRRAAPGAGRLSLAQQRVARQAEQRAGMPAVDSAAVEILDEAGAVFNALLADIEGAASTCHLQFYIWGLKGRAVDVSRAVIDAARRGVACRVLVDNVGSRAFLGSELARAMRDAGVRIEDTMPVGPFRSRFARADLRNHRKIAVIDGAVAYTGSMNLVDPEYFRQGAGVGKWLDIMARVRGPVVEALGAIFIREWELATDDDLDELLGKANVTAQSAAGDVCAQVAPSGPTPTAGSIHEVTLSAIYEAQQRLTITTPYFVPDPALRIALTSAADRGARVRLILPRRVDSRLVHYASRAFFEELLDRGIEIHRYRDGLLHTKLITIDDHIALLGTVNLDPRSFFLNFENTLLIYDDGVARALREIQEGYIARSEPVDLDRWRQRHIGRRFLCNLAQLFSPVL
ncbi:MAG: cardiolipin synthase [Phycisphaerales bacterium JB039]